ncbi:MAG: hypothetical protein ACRCX8_09990 [Sarcina sp.]
MIVNKPKGLVKPEVKPTPNNLQGNKVKLQPKCRFCKHLNPWVDRELDEVMMCFELGVVDKGDVDKITECPEFRLVDELKEVVE